jgi:Asp/Glu/hydantoin racemase
MRAGPMKICFQKHTVEGRLAGLDDTYRRHFGDVARPDTQVEIRTLPPEAYAADVPEGLVRYGAVEALFASYFVFASAQAAGSGFDAFIVGASQDPGLPEARAVAGMPVLGYGETAFHLAAMTGRSFGIVGFIPELEEPIRENLARYGLVPKLRGFQYLDAGATAVVEALQGSPGRFLEAFAKAADRITALGAEVIIPGEGLPNEILWAAGIKSHNGAAILDVDGALIKTAELLVDLRHLGSLEMSGNGYRSRRPPGEAMSHLLSVFQPACSRW